MLLREADSTGRIDFLKYFARLARRILAPAALVIGTTTLLGLMILPMTRHSQLVTEARASLLYFENFELIRSQLSYEAAGPETSPFQHFWSLSVQGQFYLIWPAVALIAVWLSRRTRFSPASSMAGLIGLLMAGSFSFALYLQQHSQAEAYLLTQTRIWELGFGGILALLGARLVLPRPVQTAAGWLGLALIISCGFLLDGAALFPGPWALWPLVGLALVMASAARAEDPSDGMPTAQGLLATGIFSRLGDIAYGLYLWHWPLVIFVLELRGDAELSAGDAVLVLGASLLLGWLTYRLLEQPLARRRPTDSAGRSRSKGLVPVTLAAGSLVIGGLATTAYVQLTMARDTDGLAMAGVDRQLYPGADIFSANDLGVNDPGAIDLGPNDGARDVAIYPELGGISLRVPEYARRDDCHQPTGNEPGTGEVLVCEDSAEPADPTQTIMLAGGSHAGHWHNAWIMLAERHNWEVLVSTKGGCVFRANDPDQPSLCDDWNDAFPEMLKERSVDLVVTPGTAIPREPGTEQIHDGAQARWEQITGTGTDLLLLRGTPRQEENVPDCLAQGDDALECAPAYAKFAESNPLTEIDLPDDTYTLDLTDHFCPAQQCSAVIGNVLVYRDSHHLTNEYVETMVPHLERNLRESMPQLFGTQAS